MVIPIKSPILRQYLIVVAANFGYLCFGLETGWSSPVIAKLKDVNQTVLPQPISDDDAAWAASIGILAGMFVMLISGFLMDRLGRKPCLIIAYIPRLIKCFLLLFASEVWMLLLGRALNGLSDIFGICLIITYTSEIASKEIRGALGTVTQMSFAVGIMIMLTVGPFLSYIMLNLMATVIEFALFLPVLFLPETPYFLYSRGRESESIEVLTYLRGSQEAAHQEIKEYTSNTKVTIDKVKLFKDGTFWKALGSGCVLVIGAQFTGYNSISYYLQNIFASTHTSVSPEVSSSIIGCIELLACFCTILLTDRLGRKPILIVSLAFISIGMIGLGTFFYLKNHNFDIEGFLNYLPLLSIMLIIFCYNASIGSIMMMYIAELFDGSSRAIGVSITVFVAGLVTFLFIRYFATVTNLAGPMSTYYGFSIGSLILCLFTAFCLPETKGKAFSDIQKEIRKSEMENVEKRKEIYDSEVENECYVTSI